MARTITVRQPLSGEEGVFEVLPRMTVREFRNALHGWLPCDESKRKMSSVELIVGDAALLNNKQTVFEAIPVSEVMAFLSIKPARCSSFEMSGCEMEDLRVVEIPEGVTEVGRCAFHDCSSLTSVTIPNSVTRIRQFAFAGCSSLESIIIPDSVIKIGDSAFEDCSSLASVAIPKSVTVIGECAFQGCSSLANVTIPDSANEIGLCAFASYSLASVTIPKA